ncbi:MFS transporter [Chitinibacteraceae bacterium HSL-7]
MPASLPRYAVLTLALIQFAHIVDFTLIMPLAPALTQAFALEPGQFALLVAAYPAAAAASCLLAAGFIDRFERKRALLTLFTLFTLATAATALAPAFWALLLARVLAGAFGGMLTGMSQTLVGDLVPPESRGRASATLMSANAVAAIAGVPIALLIAEHADWRMAFAVLAACAAAIGALAAFQIPRHTPVRPPANPVAAVKATLSDRHHRLALLFMALGGASTFVLVPFITLYLTQNVGLDSHDIPLIYAVGGTASLLAARLIGRIADARGKAWAYRAVALASLLPILALTHLPAVALAVTMVITTLFFLVGPVRGVAAMALTINTVHPAQRGAFMLVCGAVAQLSLSVAAWLGGHVFATVGFAACGWLAITLTAATYYLAGRVSRPAGQTA